MQEVLARRLSASRAASVAIALGLSALGALAEPLSAADQDVEILRQATQDADLNSTMSTTIVPPMRGSQEGAIYKGNQSRAEKSPVSTLNHNVEVRWTFDDGTAHPRATEFYECIEWRYFGALSDGPACRDSITLEWSYPPCSGITGVRSFQVLRREFSDLIRVDCRAEMLAQHNYFDS